MCRSWSRPSGFNRVFCSDSACVGLRVHTRGEQSCISAPQTGETFSEPATGLNQTTANGKEAPTWEGCQGAPCLPSAVLIHSAVLPRVASERERFPVSLAPGQMMCIRVGRSKVVQKGCFPSEPDHVTVMDSNKELCVEFSKK